MFELYRSNFNSIDVFNRLATGPLSMVHAIGTQVWWKRALFGFISMCEANAYLAYCHTVEGISRHEWRERLGYELVRFGGAI